MTVLGSGEPCIAFGTIDSTNEEARRRFRAGAAGPLWIRADRQSAGRGRRGRTWVSEPGNLFASLLLTAARPPAALAQLSFVAALAVHDALSALSGEGGRLRCKWPNDLLVGGRKIAGLLLESEMRDDVTGLVVGFGINLSAAPEDVERPATAFEQAFGRRVSPPTALEAVAMAFAARRALWQDRGFAPVREAWLARADGIGSRIEARLGDKVLTGRFSDLDADGALVLTPPAGAPVRIMAGEVFPLSEGA